MKHEKPDACDFDDERQAELAAPLSTAIEYFSAFLST
jgi:hypothetical protein